jgi:hypothetical protein
MKLQSSIKFWEIHEQLSDWRLLKDSAPWHYLVLICDNGSTEKHCGYTQYVLPTITPRSAMQLTQFLWSQGMKTDEIHGRMAVGLKVWENGKWVETSEGGRSNAVLMQVLGGHRLKYVLRLRRRSITSSGTAKELALRKRHLKWASAMEKLGAKMA